MTKDELKDFKQFMGDASLRLVKESAQLSPDPHTALGALLAASARLAAMVDMPEETLREGLHLAVKSMEAFEDV